MNGIYKMKNAGTSGISYTVHVEIKFIGGANEKTDEPIIITKDCFVIRATYERK